MVYCYGKMRFNSLLRYISSWLIGTVPHTNSLSSRELSLITELKYWVIQFTKPLGICCVEGTVLGDNGIHT